MSKEAGFWYHAGNQKLKIFWEEFVEIHYLVLKLREMGVQKTFFVEGPGFSYFTINKFLSRVKLQNGIIGVVVVESVAIG